MQDGADRLAKRNTLSFAPDECLLCAPALSDAYPLRQNRTIPQCTARLPSSFPFMGNRRCPRSLRRPCSSPAQQPTHRPPRRRVHPVPHCISSVLRTWPSLQKPKQRPPLVSALSGFWTHPHGAQRVNRNVHHTARHRKGAFPDCRYAPGDLLRIKNTSTAEKRIGNGDGSENRSFALRPLCARADSSRIAPANALFIGNRRKDGTECVHGENVSLPCSCENWRCVLGDGPSVTLQAVIKHARS